MSISTRTQKLIRKGNAVTPIVLVEFASFLDEDWGRLSPYGNIEISDDVNESPAVTYTYYDYFTGSFPTIATKDDLFSGGLTSIGNLTLVLNNAGDLVKSMRDADLADGIEGTEVNVYVLLSIGGTEKRSNAELRFSGRVRTDPPGLTWDADKIKIRLETQRENGNVGLLKTRVTRKDFPNIEDSVDGKFLPIVGGAWFTNHGNNHTFGDLWSDTDQYVRVLDENITSPAMCLSTIDNKYKIADHPTATTLGSMLPDLPSGYSAFPRRTIGKIFKSDNGNLHPMYNGDTETVDGSPTITIPANQAVFQAFVVPKNLLSKGSEIPPSDPPNPFAPGYNPDRPERMLDKNQVMETGENAETSAAFWVGSFLNPGDGDHVTGRLGGLDVIIDQFATGVYLEAIVRSDVPSSARGWFVIKTDGKSWYQSGGIWVVETEPTIYRPVIYDPAWSARFAFGGGASTRVIRSVNLAYLPTDDSKKFQREDSDGVPFGNIRIPSIDVNTDMAGNGNGIFIENQRLNNWEFGVGGVGGMRIEAVYLRITDLYFQGGYVALKQIISVPTERLTGIPGLSPEERRSRVTEQKLIGHHDAEQARTILDQDNRSPIHAIIDGYTTDNTQEGTASKTPVQHMKYLMGHRADMVEDTDWDSTTFDALASRRTVTVDDDYIDRWEYHYYIDKQRMLHDALRGMAFESNAVIYSKDDKYFAIDTDWWDAYIARHPVVAQFDENDILDYSFERQKGLFDAIEINYAMSSDERRRKRTLFMTPWDTNFYESTDTVFYDMSSAPTNYDVTDNSPATLQTMLQDVYSNWYRQSGEDENRLHKLTVNADYITDVHTARRLLISLVRKHTKSRPILTMTVGIRGMEVEQCSTLYAAHTDWATIDKTEYQAFAIDEGATKQTYKIKALQIGNG